MRASLTLRHLAPFVLLVGLVALGCGTSTGDDGDDTGPQDTADVAADITGADGVDGGPDAPDVPTGPTPVEDSLCPTMGWLDPAEVVMVVPEGSHTLHLVHAGLSSTAITAPFPAVAAGVEAGTLQAHVAYPHVLTLRSDTTGDGATLHRLVLLDLTGQPVWSLDLEGGYLSYVGLATDGSATLIRSLSVPGGSEGLYISADGELTTLPGYHPMGPADTHGQIAVRALADGPPYTWGWFDPVAGGFTPVFEGFSSKITLQGDTFFHVGTGKTQPWMYAATSQESGFEVLWEIETNDFASLKIADTGHAWILLSHPPTDGLWRVATGFLAVVPVPTDPPEGWWPLGDCYDETVALDGYGRVVRTLRQEGHGQAFHVDPDTGEWTALGRPVTDINALDVTPWIGTYVLETQTAGDNFCPELTWETAAASADALPGNSLQIASWMDPILLTPGDGQLYPHRTGLCMAWLTTVEGASALQVYDVVTGLAATSPVAGPAIWVD